MAFTYLVPKETAAVLQNQAQTCENMALILGRYIPNEVIANEAIPEEKNQKYRDKWLRDQARRFQTTEQAQWLPLMKAEFRRWVALTKQGIQFTQVLSSRMMIGLGAKGALETGLILNQISGLPFIPGSALKGLTRSYMLFKIAEARGMKLDPSQPDAMNKELNKLESTLTEQQNLLEGEGYFLRFFGSQTAAGEVVFFDAVIHELQDASSLFTVDVMTPHFADYYTSAGRKAPADDGNPIPLNFLTVSAGISFAFAVGQRSGARLKPEELERAAGFLTEALVSFGIGAKTASGYGAFEPIAD